MINELKEVISRISMLEEVQQKEIAKLLLNEIDWDITLQNTQEGLNTLAQEALVEYENKRTRQNDW